MGDYGHGERYCIVNRQAADGDQPRSIANGSQCDADKIDSMKLPARFVRAVEERYSPEANFDAMVAHERAISPSLDGRTVFDESPRERQLSLFG